MKVSKRYTKILTNMGIVNRFISQIWKHIRGIKGTINYYALNAENILKVYHFSSQVLLDTWHWIYHFSSPFHKKNRV